MHTTSRILLGSDSLIHLHIDDRCSREGKVKIFFSRPSARLKLKKVGKRTRAMDTARRGETIGKGSVGPGGKVRDSECTTHGSGDTNYSKRYVQRIY